MHLRRLGNCSSWCDFEVFRFNLLIVFLQCYLFKTNNKYISNIVKSNARTTRSSVEKKIRKLIKLDPRERNIAPERKGISGHPHEVTAEIINITFKPAVYSCTYLFYDINVWRNVSFKFRLLNYVQMYF